MTKVHQLSRSVRLYGDFTITTPPRKGTAFCAHDHPKRNCDLAMAVRPTLPMTNGVTTAASKDIGGDDCNVLPRTENAPNEPSAFGRYNATSGPFFVASPKLAPSSSAHGREPRDWEREDVIVDKSGYHAPAHVGKQGRKKDRAKMERRAREQELDDEEDWFGKTPNSRDRHSKEHSKSPSKKLTFGSSLRPSSRTFDSSAKPRSERSLRDRLSGEVDRPPPTEPRSWHRSNSLLKRIGDQKV